MILVAQKRLSVFLSTCFYSLFAQNKKQTHESVSAFFGRSSGI